ncbi:aldehyde dehydrogenase family protein [Nocardioides sp. LHG3406-4]|uniref:aldehyde dehydrogenase family protein n=1 Tax=Nocardioides sp. LHG3406-4 TaxID=2804575 RepID=UPI003CF4490E
MTVTTIDPATEREIAHHETHDEAAIEAALGHAAETAKVWGRTPLDDRVALVRGLAGVLRRDRQAVAELITREMGKPVAEALGEVEKSALTADYYASKGPIHLADERVEIESVEAWISYEPMGVLFAVMPWNFPLWQVMRFAIPAVTAGNAVVLKHSPNVTGTALAIERLFVSAGFPEHLLTTLVVAEADVPAVSRSLIEDDRIAAVTLTGSNRAGAAVGAIAGGVTKKSVLELGGSDAFVVLADADVSVAAEAAARARFTNCGQSCVCAKRFIVDEQVADNFVAQFVAHTLALTVGDPFDPATRIGPLARQDLRDGVERQVASSLTAGAELLAGGRPVSGPGWFFEPTVLGRTGPGMAAFDEETFGPVAAIAVATGEDHAIELADGSPYGLALSVWSGSRDRALGVARQITTGAAFVNAVVMSDPRLPFGGTKASGHGRELAAAGIREFVNTRAFWVAGG